jgi:hypothetical protein
MVVKASVYIGAVLQSTTALYAAPHYTAVMTSARRLVMDCVSFRLDCTVSIFPFFVRFPPLFSLRLDESDQQRQQRHSRLQKKMMTFFSFLLCLCAFDAVSSLNPRPSLYIFCIRRTLITLKEIFFCYSKPRIQDLREYITYSDGCDAHGNFSFIPYTVL